MKQLCLFLLPLAAFAAAPSNDWAPNLTASATWHGNISNGSAVWDRIGTFELGADIVASSGHQLSPADTLTPTLHLAGDWFPRFHGLDDGMLGARIEWRHIFGPDSSAPILAVEAGGDGVLTGEQARRGLLGFVSLRVSKQFGSRWRIAVGERFERYNASQRVFDRESSETTIEISRDINEEARFVLSGRWRQGDVVTYAHSDLPYPARPDLDAVAHDFAPSSTFHRPMIAYAADARSIGGRAAFVHAMAPDTAVIFAYDYSNTDERAVKFENHSFSLSWVRQY